MDDETLLDPAFVRSLEGLRVALRQRVKGVRAGDHRTHRRGQSVEFAEHRPYTPGDDPRRIDWNAYARLGDLVVRLFVAEEDVTVHLLLDASASMGFGTPSKLSRARRLAAALGYLALTGTERVSLSVSAADLARPVPALRGRAAVPALLKHLDALRPVGHAPLEQAASRAVTGPSGRSSVAVVLTDALDQGASLRACWRLAAARHAVTLVHLLCDDELRPPPDDVGTLVDSETGESLDLALDDEALERYQTHLRAWLADLAGQCARRGVRYVRAFDGREPLEVLGEVLTGRARDHVPVGPQGASPWDG